MPGFFFLSCFLKYQKLLLMTQSVGMRRHRLASLPVLMDKAAEPVPAAVPKLQERITRQKVPRMPRTNRRNRFEIPAVRSPSVFSLETRRVPRNNDRRKCPNCVLKPISKNKKRRSVSMGGNGLADTREDLPVMNGQASK